MARSMGQFGSYLLHMLCALAVCSCVSAQQKVDSPQAATTQAQDQANADAHKKPAERGVIVDRIVGIVNGDLVLESDVDEEERFSQLYPYGVNSEETPRQQAITRLIDRTLVLQQMAGFPVTPVSDDEVNRDESDLRKDLPECGHTDCASNAGWMHFLASKGFTKDELRARLRQRIGVLHFIEQRFRSGVRISDQQIEQYYNDMLLPEYAKQHATAPPLDSIRDRIQEILLQQQVSSMMDSWLKTLRDSGHVRMLEPDEEAP